MTALRWLVVWCALLLGAAAGAEPLAGVRRTALPPLPAATPVSALARVDGALVAWSDGRAWRLDETVAAWQPFAAGGGAQQVFGNDAQTWAIDGTAVRRVDAQAAPQPPPLPEAVQGARGTVWGNDLVVAGRAADGTPRLWRITPSSANARWQPMAPWPGGGAPSALIAQTNALFVAVPQGATEAVWRWSADRSWQARSAAPGRVLPGAARATGQAHLLFLLQPADGSAPKLATLHTITDAWAMLAVLPGARVQQAGAWRTGLVWAEPSGAGGTAFAGAEIEAGKLLLKPLDWVVIVVYLATMLGMGGYFYLREKRQSTSEFFLGGRSIPFWAAGVSLYAANTSSISYIAIPAKAFETNWTYLTNNLVAVLGLMFVAVWIVPLLRRLDLMSVFHYLEIRFHPAIRVLASALCILVQLGSRMSVILYLPALAIATITGLPVMWSVLIMGTFTIIYTALGGMKAVVWTDIVQLVVKMGGALFAIGFMIWALKGGWGELKAVAAAADKTQLLDFSFDLTKATVWGFVFLVLFDVVLTFPKDQVLMQRVLSTPDSRDAGRSVWAFAAIMIPGGFVFYSIGTTLFAYYKAYPERMNPLLSIDATFPLFIAAELPSGVTGLIVAGIFAAAMATLSSIMNSVATLASVDFYEKLVKNPDPAKSVRFAEAATVVAGLIGIGLALLLSRYDVHSLFDVSIELAGLLGGGFAGAYTLGMFTRRANSPGVAIGIACSASLTLVAWTMNLVHPYFYLAISILLCIVIGYAASWFFPAPQRSLEGLTIYGKR